MLDNLIKDLEKIKKELESIDTNSDKERARIEELADKVLNIFENADIELPEEHPEDGGKQTPGSKV